MKLKSIAKELVPEALGLIGGSVAADFLDKPLSSLNPYLRNGGKIVVGAVIMALGKKQRILSGLGGGMIANGGSGVVKQLTEGGTAPATAGMGFTDNAIGEEWQPTPDTKGMGFAGVSPDNAIGAVDTIGGEDII